MSAVHIPIPPIIAAPAPIGHNGGPPLEDEPYRPPWGSSEPGRFLVWKAAEDKVWRNLPREIVLSRLRRATALGLTFREYTLEILERGHHLGPLDSARIAEIIAARGD